MDFTARKDVPMARETTLEVGGNARFFVEPFNTAEVVDVVNEVRRANLALLVIGSGSNIVVADSGFDGVVVRSCDFGIEVERRDDDVIVRVGAGVEWDELVEFCVAEGYAGLECLSGIPGRVGGAPVQNIGAYGAEFAGCAESVEVVDSAGSVAVLSAVECGFGYRDSVFKRTRQADIVTSVTVRLRAGGEPVVRYDELRRTLGLHDGAAAPSLGAVRAAVLEIRRSKSMVWDEADENRRSVGSFFVNPIVDAEAAAALAERFASSAPPPAWLQPDGRVKLSAAWLIERAGFGRGYTFGQAGISSRHALALINRGRASAADIVNLAGLIRRAVRREFGVTLRPEAVFVGFDREADALLG